MTKLHCCCESLIAATLLIAIALGLACSNDPSRPAENYSTDPYTWATIDSFEAGDRMAAICGVGPGDVFCATLGLERYSDGWTVHPEGSVIRYAASAWSSPLYDIHATIWDLDMWAASASDVYLADGTLRHYDGVSWSDLGIPANVVYGVSASDVYAASTKDGKAVRHYDGAEWSLLTHFGGDLSGDDDIEAIWAAQGPFVAVLRSHGISMWDGSAWTNTEFRDYDYVYDLWGSTPDNLYVVGDPYSGNGEVIHYDGSTWEYPAIPEVPRLNSVWGSGPTDVYAVGERGAILHFDGASWKDLDRVTYKALREVWGSGLSDVFAVGDDGKALHFDGTKWSSIRKDKPDNHMWSMWAESATRFAVVNWIDGGTVYMYDDGVWKETYVGASGGLGSLAGRSLDDLYTLGDPGVYHFDGEKWEFDSYLDTFFPGEMWFPDEQYKGFAIGGGSIFQFNGFEWREVIKDEPWHMASLWGASADCVYAINSTGIVYHYDGVTWTRIPSPADQLIDMWGVSATEVYVLAGDIDVPSGLFRYDGASWHELSAPSGPYGSALMLNSSKNMFSWGGCWLSHFDGSRWKVECTPHDSPVAIVEARDGSILKLTEHTVSRQAIGLINP